MRPIKFRAWYKNEKLMLPIAEITFHKDGDVLAFPLTREAISSYLVGGNVVLMQSTGLFDKNGKEILEGDILNYCDKNKILYIVRYGSYNCNSGYKHLAPQYIGASFYLEILNQELLREDLPIYSHNDCAFLYPVTEDFHNFEEYKKNWGLAVVGNIYENPELINR